MEWVPGIASLSGFDGAVRSMVVFDGGTGPELIAGGNFVTSGSFTANRVAKWDGVAWSALGGGTNGPVAALAVFDDGSGPAVYAGGGFDTAGGVAANRVAKWDGTSWFPLGGGTSGSVYALAVFDDGAGPALYAGGAFDSAGGVTVGNVAKWNGSTWSSLGSGVREGISTSVDALATFDSGEGSALFVGGCFNLAGGVVAANVAKWDGSFWSALGCGVDSNVLALTVFDDDGSGPALYAGGFSSSGSIVCSGSIAKWSGGTWSALGRGIRGGFLTYISALAEFDDGSGSALYAAGGFGRAGDVLARNIAKWDGDDWSAMGSGTDLFVSTLASYDDGTGRALYVGGESSPFFGAWAPRRRGTVNTGSGSPPADVLFVNASAGDPRRIVRIAVDSPVSVSLRASPAGPASARYVAWIWAGVPPAPIDFVVGSSLGCTAGPTPFHRPLRPQPVATWRGGFPALAGSGTRELPSPARAPWTVARNRGSRRPLLLTIQGLLQDRGAAVPLGLSVTNAVVVRIE